MVGLVENEPIIGVASLDGSKWSDVSNQLEVIDDRWKQGCCG